MVHGFRDWALRTAGVAVVVWSLSAGLVAAQEAEADRPLREVLFDFEDGVAGWHGNPWGGGACGAEAEAGTAPVGRGALTCRYTDVEKGANVLSPFLPDDAAWRGESWGFLTFWLKGDGTPGGTRIILECAEAEHATYSRQLSLQPASWQRVSLPLHTFWNRGGKRLDVSRLRRLYFAANGTHTFGVDHIALEAAHRVVPLDPLPTAAIPLLSARPELDGEAAEPCWRQAARLPDFVRMDGSASAVEQTECRLFHDGGRLYVAAVLRTQNPEKLKATFSRHDAALYKDDCFEVFVGNPAPTKRNFQFVVNPNGATLDLGGGQGTTFEHDWEAAAARRPDGWSVELSIALAGLVPEPVTGQAFALNLARENRVTGELSCWSATGRSFLVPSRFGHALLLASARGAARPAPEWLDLGDGVYGARAVGVDAQTGLRLRARFEFGRQAFEASASVPADGAEDGLVLAVPTAASEEGWGRVVFALGPPDSTVPDALHAGRTRVFLPAAQEPVSPLPVVPSPKEISLTAGTMALPATLRVGCVGGAVDERTRRYLARVLNKWYGIACRFDPPAAATADVLLWQPGEDGPSAAPGLDVELSKRLASLPTDGYVLRVTSGQAVLAANNAPGLHHAVLTFLQTVECSTSAPSAPEAACCRVVDWPSLKWRAVRVGLPTTRWGHPNNAPVDIDFFCDFIERSVVRRKFNMLVIEINAGLRYESRPEIAGPAAWSREEHEQLLQLCRDHFIEPVPLVNSYGHAGYLSLRHQELREDGRLNTICTRHPGSWALLTDLYTELLELFAPVNYFHVGLDEIRWQTLDVPEAKRCARCAGVSKGELLAAHVTRVRDWFHERGVRTVMWGDQLLPEHNGGPPYRSVEALARLPRDVIIANWSTSLAAGSNRRFHDLGFTVWQSNSRGVNREQAAYCEGNMFGAWDKRPWLSDCPWRSAQRYNYLSFLVAGEYSWNLWPELSATKPELSATWFRTRERTLVLDALQPEPAAGGRSFTVELAPNFSSVAQGPAVPDAWFGASVAGDLRHVPRGAQHVGGARFDLRPPGLDCVVPVPRGAPEAARIEIGRRAAGLRFLHTVHVAGEQEAALTEAFKDPAYWAGIPCGEYRIVYADRSVDRLAILYPYNVKRWDTGDRIPYVLRSAGTLPGATEATRQTDPNGRDVCLYAAQWVNRKPGTLISHVELHGGTLATPVLFAVTGREVAGSE